MTTALIGARIKFLREAHKLNQDDLAAKMGFKDRQTISTIETGDRQVKAEELLSLSDIFDVDLDYFTNPFRLVGEGQFSWRQHKRSNAELHAYEATAGNWIAIYRNLAPRVGKQPLLSRPKLPLGPNATFEDAMAAGERVCEELKLGSIPAPRLAQAMERQFNILVLMVDTFEGISGAACRLPELDAVLINRKESLGRRHFDLAHELFHIMTWEQMPPDYSEDTSNTKKGNRVEQLANNFAAALLMPAKALTRVSDWHRLTMSELTDKLNEVADWLQVTAQALKFRLCALKLLTEDKRRQLNDDLLRNNGKDRQDGETPLLFSASFMAVIFEAIDQGFISRRRAAQELHVDTHGLDGLIAAHVAAAAQA